MAGVHEFHELREPVDGRRRSVKMTTRRTTDTEEAVHTTILVSSASRYPRVVTVIIGDGLLQTLAAVRVRLMILRFISEEPRSVSTPCRSPIQASRPYRVEKLRRKAQDSVPIVT